MSGGERVAARLAALSNSYRRDVVHHSTHMRARPSHHLDPPSPRCSFADAAPAPSLSLQGRPPPPRCTPCCPPPTECSGHLSDQTAPLLQARGASNILEEPATSFLKVGTGASHLTEPDSSFQVTFFTITNCLKHGSAQPSQG